MDLSSMNPSAMLEQVKSKVKAALGANGQEHGGLIDQVMQLVTSHAGGLGGLVSAFKAKGMGGIISSWVGTGPNQPVTGDQVAGVIGQDKVAAIAGKLGMPVEKVQAGLASVLPLVVDHLTPGGTVPELPGAGGLGGAASSLFK